MFLEMGKLFALILVGVNCFTMKMRQETGTAFALTDMDVNFFIDQPRVTININSPSPRILLNHEEYGKCDETFKMNNQPLCMHQFNQYDTKVFEFLDLGLVIEAKNQNLRELYGDDVLSSTTSIRNIEEESSHKKLKELQLKKLKALQILDTTTGSEERRVRRVAPIVAVGGIASLAVGSFTGGYQVGKSKSMAEVDLVDEELETHKAAILKLSKVINLNEKNIAEIARKLKTDPEIVLSSATELAFDIKYRSSLTKNDFQPYRMDLTNSLHISELATTEYQKFTRSCLTLQNHRLPLEKNFLLAIRAKCLSLQLSNGPAEQKFCNELAFYSTRWDTGLEFHGIGLSYLDVNKTIIKDVIYSFSVDIPVLDGSPLQMINLYIA